MDNFDYTFNSLFNIGDTLKQIQSKVNDIEATGESGAGDVRVIVNGKREVIKVEIDDSMINVEKKKFLEELTAAAVNSAMKNLVEKVKTEVLPEGMMNMMSNIDKE